MADAVALALFYRSNHYGKKIPDKVKKRVVKVKDKYNLSDDELIDLAQQCWDFLTTPIPKYGK